MRDALRIFRRYLPPYKRHIFLNVLFNFLGALFGIFSFIAMIPLLEIIFGLKEWVTEPMEIVFSFKPFYFPKDEIINNLYYHIYLIADHSENPLKALIIVGLLLIFLVFLKTGLTYLGSFYMVKIRNNVVRDIRNQIFRKIIYLPLQFFTEERKGDIISRTTEDVKEIEHSIMNSLDMFFKNPIIILLSVVTMVIMSWQLTLFVFILFPVAGTIIGRIGKSLKKISLDGQNKMGEILSIIEESISGLRIIKAFNAENFMKKRLGEENENLRKILNNVMWRNYMASPVSEFMGTIIVVIVMWFGGSLILGVDIPFLNENSSLPPAHFLVYLVLFYNIINPTKAFAGAFYNIQKGMASILRIDRVLDIHSNITEITKPLTVREFNDSIIYKDVWFKYQKSFVLKNIDLEVKKGRTIALVGQSGSGKSTLVDLLPRFYDVVKGSVSIDGKNIRSLKLSELRGLMGYVNQEPILFNDTIFNNIAFGVDHANEENVIESAKVANAHEFIIKTPKGYQTNIGDRGGKLSGGQRQRLSIARAVLKNPPILLLDEATSALDTESERLVQDALTKLMKNRTTIVVAHRLSTIVHADEICILRDGEIVERGKHEELLKKRGEYKKYYELQNFG